jgi:hypothetical protein
MLQILVFAVCGVIVGVGYCGMMLARIATKDKPVQSNGSAVFLLLTGLALIIVLLSINQAHNM